MKAVLAHSEKVAQNIRTFWFQPEAPMHYLAGQYTQINLPHAPVDARGVQRWFTLSSSPSEAPLVAITTKFARTDGSSFKHKLAYLRPGQTIQLTEAMGDFVLPKNKHVPIVFVAGGIGITPIRSITKWLLDKKEQRDITLLYAVARPEEIAFADLFKTYYAERYVPMVTTPGLFWNGLNSQLTADFILDYVPNRTQTLIYLAGPRPMIENLEKQLLEKGIDKKLIVTDFYPGYNEI